MGAPPRSGCQDNEAASKDDPDPSVGTPHPTPPRRAPPFNPLPIQKVLGRLKPPGFVLDARFGTYMKFGGNTLQGELLTRLRRRERAFGSYAQVVGTLEICIKINNAWKDAQESIFPGWGSKQRSCGSTHPITYICLMFLIFRKTGFE